MWEAKVIAAAAAAAAAAETNWKHKVTPDWGDLNHKVTPDWGDLMNGASELVKYNQIRLASSF